MQRATKISQYNMKQNKLETSKLPGGPSFMTVVKGLVLKSSKTKLFHFSHSASFAGRGK